MTITEQKQFENETLNKIAPYLGKKNEDLFEYFYVKRNPKTGNYPKNANGIVINRILKTDIDEEMKRKIKEYNISIRSIRITANKKVKESMSLPNIDFEEIVGESWESSSLRQYLTDIRYLFVVFQELEGSVYQLKGAKFWSMPTDYLEKTVKSVWVDTIETIKNGVELKYNSKQKRVSNNFVKSGDQRIVHVRPRAAKSSYSAYNPNAERLPVPANWINKPKNYSDNWMTRQCFWLNNRFILQQIADFVD